MRLASTVTLLLFIVIVALNGVSPVLAEDLDSTNYRLLDPGFVSTDSKGEQSTNYQFLGDARGLEQYQISSSLYKVGTGHGYTFMANVPQIACFVIADATGACTNQLNECGSYNCYDRARFEIDPQGNPADTLYTVEISPNNWTTTYYLDGATHYPETSATHTIADYRTEAQWESTDVGTGANIFGLSGSTGYKVRARALQGDFTESPNSPDAGTTITGAPTIGFNIDVGSNPGSNPSPYSVRLRNLNITQVTTAAEKVYFSLTSNAISGISVQVRDTNNGLYSASQNYTIPSNDDTLDQPEDEGYGLAVTATGQSNAPGYFRPATPFVDASNYVGGLDLTNRTILCSRTGASDSCTTGSGSPVEAGTATVEVRAKARIQTPAVSDYTDRIIFNVTGAW